MVHIRKIIKEIDLKKNSIKERDGVMLGRVTKQAQVKIESRFLT